MNFNQLISSLQELDSSLKAHASRSANVGLTARNWVEGAYIVEFEQSGEERAKYGEMLMPELAKRLKIPGLNLSNLKSAKAFALAYPQKGQTLSGFSPEEFTHPLSKTSQSLSAEAHREISQSVENILPVR